MCPALLFVFPEGAGRIVSVIKWTEVPPRLHRCLRFLGILLELLQEGCFVGQHLGAQEDTALGSGGFEEVAGLEAERLTHGPGNNDLVVTAELGQR